MQRDDRWIRRVAFVVGVALVIALGGCSSSDPGDATQSPPATTAPDVPGSTGSTGSITTPSGTRPTTTVAPYVPAACDRLVAAPVFAAPVFGSTSDWDITSFDGVRIRAHWFPLPQATADRPAPVILMGPGWGLAGDANPTADVDGALTIKDLRAAGYHVLTWDPRGFGQSTGVAEIDSTDHEGRDVQRLLDWVASLPGVQLDGPGDPRTGMVGDSYGGAIQVVTAAADCRVDAIAPKITWHSLTTSLYKSNTFKAGWAGLLANGATGHFVDLHFAGVDLSGSLTGTIDATNLDWLDSRGLASALATVTVPTLVVQGTVDTLFTPDESVATYRTLRDRDVPTAMVWFCGGHGTCLTNPGDRERSPRAALAWMNRYVKRDALVDTGARVDLLDQNGARYTADDYPVPAGAPIVAEGHGSLTLTADGGSGPAPSVADPADPLRGFVGDITAAKATHSIDVDVPLGPTPALILGAPRLELSYQGTTPAGDRPTRVFAQLVDTTSGFVVDNQITPIEVVLDGRPHDIAVPLEIITFAAQPGHSLTLQLVATTVAYAPPRLGGTIAIDRARISLPVAAGLTPR